LENEGLEESYEMCIITKYLGKLRFYAFDSSAALELQKKAEQMIVKLFSAEHIQLINVYRD